MSNAERNKAEEGTHHRCSPLDARDTAARPRNWLVATTLLALREGDSYGYELLKRAATSGFEAPNPGTLYRSLCQMQKEGLCKSRWESSPSGEGPARRVYSITGAGEAHLELWAKSLKRWEPMIGNFFRVYGDESRRESLRKPAADGDGNEDGYKRIQPTPARSVVVSADGQEEEPAAAPGESS